MSQFYQGTTLLNSDATAPYAYSWTGVAAGTYSITAKAYDNTSGITTSTVVSITVNAAGGTCTAAQYVAGTTYATGTSVQNNGRKYTCTVGGWCSSSAAWAYAPGTGSAWQSAWTDLGNCTSRLAEETAVFSKITIYPNPSNGTFAIEVGENATATVFNTVGTQVTTVELVKGENNINLSLVSGLYIININNQISKLIIE